MPILEFGTATAARNGEPQSGDRHLVEPFPDGVLMGVVDGLGHGQEAALAAEAAVAALKEHPSEPLVRLIRHCHESLRCTRGVVLSLASFQVRKGTMTWLGVGNVEGVLLYHDPRGRRQREVLLLRGGVVGDRLPFHLKASVVPVERDNVVIFATDGIRSDFAHDLTREGSPQELANYIMARYERKTDDALVLVARYLGGNT